MGLRTKIRPDSKDRRSGGRFFRGHIYYLLKNVHYIGRIPHRGQSYPGNHEAIVDGQTWNAVQQRLANNCNGNRTRRNANSANLLVGLLADANGNHFTPSHTVNDGRRYRYYVDRALITGDGPARSKVRRIPAVEIEELVRGGIADLLDNPARLIDALGEEPDFGVLEQVIRQARQVRQHALQSTSKTWSDHIRPFLHQVIIDEGSVRLRLLRSHLRIALGLPTELNAATMSAIYDFAVPARVTMRGVRLKLIVGASGQRCAPDPVLIKILVKSQHWWRLLSTDHTTSIRAISEAEGCSASYVSRTLRLAFLAPDIVEAILDGRQPAELTAKQLLLREDLPLEWREQRRRLGFAAR